MLEPDACMATLPGIGEDMFWGVLCRTIGEDAVAWVTAPCIRPFAMDIPFGPETGTGMPLTVPFAIGCP